MTTEASASEASREGWLQSSTVRFVVDAGQAEGREYGLAESTTRTLALWLGRQAKQKFAGGDVARRALLDGLAQAFARERLDELADRLVTASSWTEWLAGIEVPPPAPGLPEYTRDLEIDLARSEPSIDTYMRMGMQGGGSSIVHLRIQKWYQPDLDGVLYKSSLKLEKLHGSLPMVAVFLMWPPAEGPGMTGQYVERDKQGKVGRTITYTIRRAWEFEPEEVMHSPSTMLLAPLTRRSRERMPEIMQLVHKGLDEGAIDAKTREMVWDAVFWSMGLICDMDEARRALGDQLARIQNSTGYLAAKGQSFLDAHAAAIREGPLLALRALVLRQATRRFGESPDAAAALAGITALESLEALAQRVLTAASWESLLEQPR